MLVSDSIIWLSTFLLGLYFTMESLSFPFRGGAGPRIVAGDIWGHIRVTIFPFLAGGAWYVMASFSNALNNCSATFDQCYTNPTAINATSISHTAQGGGTLFLFFFGLAIVFWVIGFILVIYFAFRPLQEAMGGKETV